MFIPFIKPDSYSYFAKRTPSSNNAGSYPLYQEKDLTLEEILNERSRELAWEGCRRQDLIRFGKWNDAWYEKEAKGDFTKLFPIPYWAIDTNVKLKQNPGYY